MQRRHPLGLRQRPHWGAFICEWVADSELSLHPELAELRSMLHELWDAMQIGDSPGLGISFVVPPKHTDFLWAKCVKKKGRMSCHQKLDTSKNPNFGGALGG